MTITLVEEMLACCHRRDIRRLQFLLSLDSSLIIESNMDGLTCLHISCLAGDETMTDFLLDKGANVHARTVDGSTPLCEAAAGGWTNIMRKLIDHGALINPPCQLVSALHEAAQFGKTECCRLLISLGANLDKSDCWYGTPLHAAVHSGQIWTAKILLDAGSNVNAKKIHSTPLHYACERGDWPMIVLLLLYGADVYCLNNNEKRPSQLLPIDHTAQGLMSNFESQPRSLAFYCRISLLTNVCSSTTQQGVSGKRDIFERYLDQLKYPKHLVKFLLHGDTEELIQNLTVL